jgi:hypothetical protein
VTAAQICDLLTCIGDGLKAQPQPTGFKCKLMAINPNQVADIFGDKAWFPLGQTDVTIANWAVVKRAISYGINHPQPQPPTWDSPSAGLSAKIPACNSDWPAGEYVILMFFDTEWLQVYCDGKPVGACPIHDNAPWRDILTNAGISLAQSSSSK